MYWYEVPLAAAKQTVFAAGVLVQSFATGKVEFTAWNTASCPCTFFKLAIETASLARPVIPLNDTKVIAAMIAITTVTINNSTIVNPESDCLEFFACADIFLFCLCIAYFTI
jgi:hypothetical protein